MLWNINEAGWFFYQSEYQIVFSLLHYGPSEAGSHQNSVDSIPDFMSQRCNGFQRSVTYGEIGRIADKPKSGYFVSFFEGKPKISHSQ